MKIDSPKVLDRLKRKVIGTKSPPMNSIAKVVFRGSPFSGKAALDGTCSDNSLIQVRKKYVGK
jgi:hypothetical protein